MANEIKLSIGQIVVHRGIELAFRRQLLPSNPETDERRDMQFEEVNTGFVRPPISHAEFDRGVLDGTIVIPSHLNRPGDELEEDENNEADTNLRTIRQKLCERFDLDPVSKSDKVLARFLSEAGRELKIQIDEIPAPSTFRDWLRTRGEPGNRRRKHMGRRRPINGRKKLLPPEIEKIIFEEAQRWVHNAGISERDVYACCRARVIELNKQRKKECLLPLRPASKSSVHRRLNNLKIFDNLRHRLGQRMAKRIFTPHKSYVKPTRILEVVIIDDTIVDCFVVDDKLNDERGKPLVIGRPRLALAIDSYSRVVVGYNIGFSDPSVETAMACIRSIATPKADLIAEQFPDLRGRFLWTGLPEQALYDRAWGYVGSSVLDALADNGISVQNAPVKNPEYKGRIERGFNTLNSRIFGKVPGGIPFKPQGMKDHELDATKSARLTLHELHRLVVQGIIDYNHDYHSGLDDVPSRVWDEQARCGVQYPEDLPQLEAACAKLAAEKTLSSRGIELKGLWYCSESVAGLLADGVPNAPRRGHRFGTFKVKVKYHPEDMSYIFVWNAMRNRYVKVYAVDRKYTSGLSEYQHDKIRAFRTQRHLEWVSEDDRCTARAMYLLEATKALESPLVGNRRRAKKTLATSQSNFLEYNIPQANEPTLIPSGAIQNRVNGDNPVRMRTRKLPKSHKPQAMVPRVETRTATLLHPKESFSDMLPESLLKGFT